MTALLMTLFLIACAFYVSQGTTWLALVAGSALVLGVGILAATREDETPRGAVIASSVLGFALWTLGYVLAMYALARVLVELVIPR